MNSLVITFKDLLNHDLVELDGLMLYSKITVDVRKCGDGSFEIESLDDRNQLYIVHPNYDGILIDQGWLRGTPIGSLLAMRFVNACELLALKKAAETPSWKWDELEAEMLDNEVGA